MTLGIREIVFMLAIMGFALWKNGWIRAILSVCLVIWGVFSLEYDIKVAGPLLGIGSILFFDAIVRMIKQSREQEA